jgi:hypothetical protein
MLANASLNSDVRHIPCISELRSLSLCDASDVRKLHTTITEADAETVLLLPWDNVTIAPPPTLQDTAEVYRTCGAELGVKVAPVGLAFDRAIRERPALNLYVSDGTHINLRGVYLTLCVLYATLFERSPVGLTYRMDDVAAWSLEYALWGLDHEQEWPLSEEQAAFLQRIAWESDISKLTIMRSVFRTRCFQDTS